MRKEVSILRISIITATYNAAKTLEQTISSIIHQDYTDVEYIIVDGGSTDDTISIIKKYESYGIKWISEPDGGLYEALNKGICMASGDYIEIIGADDALADSNVISRIASEIEDTTDILCGQVWYVNEVTKTQRVYSNTEMQDKNHYRGGMPPHAAMFVRREILLRYPFDISYRISGDYKFFLQCYYDNTIKIQYVDDFVAFFAASGISSNFEDCCREEKRLYQELNLSFSSPNFDYSSPLKRKIKQVLFRIGIFVPIKSLWDFFVTNIRWEKHVCKNEICRWCGRETGI